MPKIKSKSSVSKRFKVTGSGKVMAKYACKNHFLRRRSTSMKRKSRGMKVLSSADTKFVKAYM